MPIFKSNSEKKAYTVVLICFREGTKLKPMIIFNGKGSTIIKKLDKQDCIIASSSNPTSACRNSTLLKL